MQIHIRRHDCCGSGECAQIAPNVFQIDAKQKSMVLDPEADTPEKVLEAAEACPCSAIEVMNDEGDPIFP